MDLNDVARTQLRALDRAAAQIHTVAAFTVGEAPTSVALFQPRVVTRNGRMVERDIACGRPSNRQDVTTEFDFLNEPEVKAYA